MSPETVDIAYFPLGAAAFGGAERSILELAAAQQAAGRRVLVCYEAALESTDFMAHAQSLKLPLRRVGWAPELTAAQVAAAAWRLFGALHTPLLHFNISWRRHMWLVPLIARLRSKARRVGTMRAMPEPYERIAAKPYFGVIPSLRVWRWPDLLMGRAWARNLHATVSVNRDDYPPRLVREFAFDARRLSVIYNGVSIPALAPSAAERGRARVALGYAADDFVLAFVGRVSPEKGLRFAIDALAECDPAVQLVIAGEGEEVDALRERAERLGVAARVRFLGYVAQPYAVFRAAQVVVVPSLWNEAFGRVVVEAMACGAAVIATAVGGMQEIFEDGREGLLVPKEDAAAIAAAVDRLHRDPAELAAMAQAGRALAEARYATSRVAADYAALYAKLQSRPVPEVKHA